MTFTPQQQRALFALADAIRLTAEAFGNPAEAIAERIAIQTEEPAPTPTPAPAPTCSVEQVREMLNNLSARYTRKAVAELVGGRKLNTMDAAQLAQLADELMAAFPS
jgi:hypothetical protein